MSDQNDKTTAADEREARVERGIKVFVFVVGLAFSVFGILSNSVLFLDSIKKGGIFFAFIMALVFLQFPTRIRGKRILAVDVVLSALGVAAGLYIFAVTDRFQQTNMILTRTDYVMGIIALLIVVWATKKAVGNVMALLPVLFAAYALFGNYIPGRFGHFGFTPERFVMRMYMINEGIFGITMQTATSYIFLFIIFGAILNETGVGELFTDLANYVAGNRAGGPAKVAVIASGLMGTISGNAAANVATTGAFTIPMMKREGFSAHFAGAVEACASTGGLIMPPIMGSAAFLMTEYLGVPYSRIMMAALIPALLYYLSCFFWVHFEALRIGHTGRGAAERPALRDMKHRVFLLLPLVAIVAALLAGYTPIFAALFGMVVAILAGAVQPKPQRITFKRILKGLSNGASAAITASVACMAAGIIVGVCSMTGVGQVLTYNIISLSHNIRLLALFLTAFACFFLSMGLPATACYILVATIIAPALVKMEIPRIAAHMFVFYFASLSNITPPVAIASYTAAGIADSKPFKVAWTACKIALPGFIIPFMFAYNPTLLLEGVQILPLAETTVTAVIGVICMAMAGAGHSFGHLPVWMRAAYFVIAILLIVPETFTDAAGAVLFAALLLYDKKRSAKLQAT